ncbi:Macoilin-like [Homarus americanus]|uniref:Macoilin n=1 Tax=Homarus americanus TaxID=6706 RepID=A0A8J5K2A2_HOMAM|nr:Macoilin-like [Homarus americanus]
MKRRNVDCAKLRRPLKRTKIGEGLYGSTFVYIKFLLVWLLVLAADFLLEFRFEYLWPFWLLLRSVYDSFRYQGLAFSVLFVCMALTSDMICLLFIPVNWLFFAASTYVWVQFVWHTERGVCMPTVVLWALFIYIEALVRLKDIKNVPFHLDLCRPFAAHCIGYPVVTLGFGLKSYVGYRLRQALPPELQVTSSPDKCLKEKSEDLTLNGEVEVTAATINLTGESEAEKDKSAKTSSGGSTPCGGPSSTQTTGLTASLETEKKRVNASLQSNGSAKIPGSHTNNLRDSGAGGGGSASRDKKNKNKESNKDSTHGPKEETVSIIRLEADIKRLKADLQASRQTEQELRNQINTLISSDKITRQEMNQLQQDNDNLQNKLHGLVTARQNDRSTISGLERRLQEERRARTAAENQVAQLERRQKKVEEQSECSESCRSRRSELETELKRLRRDHRLSEDRVRSVERENMTLRQYKDNQNDTEVLMSALSAMQDKNTHLETSLSAETRVKLDLFSALGEAKRQLEISQGLVSSKDKEIEELKAKITEVLAVCPPTSFHNSSLDSTPIHYTSKLLPQVTSSGMEPTASLVMVDGLMDTSLDSLCGLGFTPAGHTRPHTVSPPVPISPTVPMSPPAPISPPAPKNPQHSTLDPNARVYTPKGTVTSEA